MLAASGHHDLDARTPAVVAKAGGLSEACSAPCESRVFDLQPISARPAQIDASAALGHDALNAKLARLGEHKRAVNLQGFTEHDRAVRSNQTLKPGAPHLERELANVLALDAQKIERHEGRSLGAGLRSQRREVAVPVGTEHDRFAIDQRAFDGQGPHRFRDPRQPIGEVGSVSGPQGDATAFLARDQPNAR